MSVMREIQDYVLDSPIALIFEVLRQLLPGQTVKKFRAAIPARQRSHLQRVYQHQTVQVNEEESAQSRSDSAVEWDNAQTLVPGTNVRMWHTTPLSPWQPSLRLDRESDCPRNFDNKMHVATFNVCQNWEQTSS